MPSAQLESKAEIPPKVRMYIRLAGCHDVVSVTQPVDVKISSEDQDLYALKRHGLQCEVLMQ